MPISGRKKSQERPVMPDQSATPSSRHTTHVRVPMTDEMQGPTHGTMSGAVDASQPERFARATPSDTIMGEIRTSTGAGVLRPPPSARGERASALWYLVLPPLSPVPATVILARYCGLSDG